MSSPIWMQNTSWINSGRQVKVGPFDGRLMIFLVLFLLHPSMFLFGLSIVAIVFFYVLEYKGYTLPNALRKFSTLFSDKRRYGVHYWRRKKI
jgi:hypothetical protein